LIDASLDGEICVTEKGERRYGNAGDLRERRGFLRKAPDELGKGISFGINDHTIGRIGHIALKTEVLSKGVHVGPETYALNNTFDYDLSAPSH
jgi:hypothetical protein